MPYLLQAYTRILSVYVLSAINTFFFFSFFLFSMCTHIDLYSDSRNRLDQCTRRLFSPAPPPRPYRRSFIERSINVEGPSKIAGVLQ
jgi:hypothetical protein